MSKQLLRSVIETKTKEERKELIDYLTNKGFIVISNIDEVDIPCLVAITIDSPICALGAVSPSNYEIIEDLERFSSVKEFTDCFGGNKDA